MSVGLWDTTTKMCGMRKIVVLEPDLEAFAGELTAHERVMLAKKYWRWAKQLYVSAEVLRGPSVHRKRLAVPRLALAKAKRN